MFLSFWTLKDMGRLIMFSVSFLSHLTLTYESLKHKKGTSLKGLCETL